MTLETRLMTADELSRLPGDGMRHELVKGELRTMPPTGVEHGGNEFRIAFNVARTLLNQQPELGEVVTGDVGFRLSRDPDTVRAPDIAFIRRERLPGGALPRVYFDGPPDLAVEIVSPSDTASDVEEKVRDWLDAGAKAVWVVYASGPGLVDHRPDGSARRLGPDDVVDGGAALPGFTMRLRELLQLPRRL